jgi:hypothetical protein
VVEAFPEPDKRDIGSLAGGHGSDVRDVDLARDHLVPQVREERRDQSQAILALVGDQHAQMLGRTNAVSYVRCQAIVRRAFAISTILACVLVAFHSASARAVTNSTWASSSEAPWMVRLYLDYPDSSTDVTWCTGVIIAPGTIATAAHCVSEHECSRVRPYQIYARFGTGLFLRFWNPQRGISVLPGYRCVPNHAARDDLAIFRFVDRWGFPAIPIATPAQVASFSNQGVTVFAGGQYALNASHQWPSSRWVRKSANGGMFVNPYCQFWRSVCVRYTGSNLRYGDSGGRWLDG